MIELDLPKIKSLLSTNYFVLFKLDAIFDIDQNILYNKYLNLQKQFHPDNFINTTKELKLLVISLSAHINSGYTTLKNPLSRALLLLELKGINLNLSSDTALPSSFLLEQMELHEAIDDAKSTKNVFLLENIQLQLKEKEFLLINKINKLFNQGDLLEIKELIKKLTFYDRLNDTILLAFEHI